MATDAPRWLTGSFAEGVVELSQAPLRPEVFHHEEAPVLGEPTCWLAEHDPRRRPCTGPLERFHFLRRQTVETMVWEYLREAVLEAPCIACAGSPYWRDCQLCGGAGLVRLPFVKAEVDEIVHLAAWDPRNGGLGCEGHHRRFDSHLTPPLPVLITALPEHVIEFAHYWALEGLLAERFPAP